MQNTKNNNESSDTRMFASFSLGETELAIAISSLQEVVNFPDKVTSLPLAPPYLTGLFNLRGMVIPIVDVAQLLKLDNKKESFELKKVAVVSVNEIRIGLLFDATSEILNVSQDNISNFDYSGKEQKAIVTGILKLNNGDRIVDIINPQELIKIENIPQLLAHAKEHSVETKKKKSKRHQCITFCAGEMEFGIEISSISEIIRIPEIKESAFATDYCLGIVSLRGTVIPILDFKKFLLMKDTEVLDRESQRIVILQIDKNYFGFLVDSVNSIVSFFEEEMLPIPMFHQEKIEMMRGLLSLPNDKSIVLLNQEKILTNSEILEVTRGHDSIYGKKENDKEKASALVNRKPYISFKLEYMLSTRLSSIDEIANVSDENLIRPPGYPDYVVGMMKMRGEIVTVINMRAYYGMNVEQTATESKILVVRGKSGRFGLLVDSVESIHTIDEALKLKIPELLTPDALSTFRGDMTDMAEMSDQSGNRSTFMIFEMHNLMEKLEMQFKVC